MPTTTELAPTFGVHESVLELIGNTPMVRLSRLSGTENATVFAKLEFVNPGGSGKSRAGLAMIEAAEAHGLLKPGGTLVEPTYGNTGIALAIAARLKGYRLVCVVPDRVSRDKVHLLRAYGAKVLLTPSDVGTDHPSHYRKVAERIVNETPGAFMPNQYFNEANPLIHYRTTGPEIWRQMAEQIDVFVAGMGTGGTISGAGLYLKEMNPTVKLIGVDAQGSRLQSAFSGTTWSPQASLIEGVGQEFIPGNLTLHLLHQVVTVSDEEAFATARTLALEEGILAGGSSGAAVAAALSIARTWAKGLRIAVVLPDDGRNYLSRLYNDDWMRDQGFLEPARSGVAVADIVQRKPTRFKDLLSVHPQDTVHKAIGALLAEDISQLPVFENGRSIGSITEKGLAERLADFEAQGRGNSADFGRLSVGEIMDAPLPMVQLSSRLANPFATLRERPSLLVADGRDPIGIITLTDIVHYFLKAE